MQTQEMIKLMQGRKAYTEKTLADLSDVVGMYPYFQTAHLLHTLNLLKLKDTHFLFSLRQSAAYLSDRKKLFYLVEGQFFASDIIEKLEKEEEETPASAFDLIDLFLSGKGELKPERESSPVSSDYVSYFLSKEMEEQPQNLPMQHQDAIDRFLEKDKLAPITIHLEDWENEDEPSAVPDLKNVDENSFFSETLAKIYLKQKKYERALEIIRKLNLIYPEKSRYFADQIRFLEKLIINKKK
jgi:hypothetical protein